MSAGWYIEDNPNWPRWGMSFTQKSFGSERNTTIFPDMTDFNLPLWLPALLTLAITIPAWRLDAIARGRGGLCTKCGYSLVGLPAGGTCPECGKPGAGSTS